jgi:2,4-dienoyl-CoA reductase-like NADH-dependent reductase (Old Yellow Enzyme family)
MSFVPITRIPSLKTPPAFRDYCAKIGADLQIEDGIVTGPASPLIKPLQWNGRTIGNRFCIHPMEGWDGTPTGGATEPMLRRWHRFGESGAKIIFGGEAMAVRPDGRANPNQLIAIEQNKKDLALLRETALKAHPGKTDDLVIGFQLTHSGRFCKPNDKKRFESRVAYRHPILDKKFGITSDAQVFTDDELKRLIEDYGRAAKIAYDVGADFVDIKHCHGYLLHELLGAHTRPGIFGGSLENRTRMLCDIVALLRSTVPKLGLAVRVSIFDLVPFKPDPALSKPGALGPGIPEDYAHCLPYRYGFGVNPQDPTQYDLTEPVEFLKICESLGITLINISGGSPYYNPHVSRPAAYPPSDGYQPPEEPLLGVARHLNVVKQLKAKFPKLILIGTAYTYLQEYLPHVAQYYLRHGHVDSVGLGRVVLSYPRILADAVETGDTERKLICRTFSDCTTAPRNGLPSGCYPLDDYYKKQPEAAQVKAIKLTMGKS